MHIMLMESWVEERSMVEKVYEQQEELPVHPLNG